MHCSIKLTQRVEFEEKFMQAFMERKKSSNYMEYTLVQLLHRKIFDNAFPPLPSLPGCLGVLSFGMLHNLVPRAMPVRGLGWHWLWGN